MQFKFNVAGQERKRLVNTVAEALAVKPKYLGAPSMAYEIGTFKVTKDGTLEYPDDTDIEQAERILETVLDAGFECETRPVEPTENEEVGLTIILPSDGLDEACVERLVKLVNSKAALIKKSLGAVRLDIHAELENGRIQFPWFDRKPEFEEIAAYSSFIVALMKFAKEAVRVTTTEKEIESEKYAFRSFLLRLGFIGEETKAYRKLLMKNLSGSAAFPNRAAAEAFNATQKAKRDSRKEATV